MFYQFGRYRTCGGEGWTINRLIFMVGRGAKCTRLVFRPYIWIYLNPSLPPHYVYLLEQLYSVTCGTLQAKIDFFLSTCYSANNSNWKHCMLVLPRPTHAFYAIPGGPYRSLIRCGDSPVCVPYHNNTRLFCPRSIYMSKFTSRQVTGCHIHNSHLPFTLQPNPAPL